MLTLATGRKFVQYLVDLRSGLVRNTNSRLYLTTIHNYIMILNTTLKRCQNKPNPDIIIGLHTWVDAVLEPQGLVNTTSNKKVLTLNKDVTTLLYGLFSLEFITTFRNTRDILNLSLFINMLVDSCGRPGELLMEQGSKVNPNKYLRWKYIKIFAFRESNSVVLRALVFFEHLKSATLRTQKQKRIPLRLLLSDMII